MKPSQDARGFTIVEAIIALFIIAVGIVAVLGMFTDVMKLRARDRGQYALGQVEETIRREVHARLRAFFRAGCTTGFNAMWTPQTTSGLQLVPLFASGPINAIREPIPSKDIGAERFNKALDRCLASWPASMPANYFTTRTDIYFCLAIRPAASWPGGQNDPISTMQPVIGEFYYTNIKSIVQATTQLRCNQLNAANPSFGRLTYNLYWRPRDERATFHQIVAGLLMLGN